MFFSIMIVLLIISLIVSIIVSRVSRLIENFSVYIMINVVMMEMGIVMVGINVV